MNSEEALNKYKEFSRLYHGTKSEEVFGEMFEAMVQATKKAVPMKPVIKHTDAWIADTYYCPVCNNRLEKGLHCNKCRQAIKWED